MRYQSIEIYCDCTKLDSHTCFASASFQNVVGDLMGVDRLTVIEWMHLCGCIYQFLNEFTEWPDQRMNSPNGLIKD